MSKTKRTMHKRKMRKNKTKRGGFSWPWHSSQEKMAQQKVERFDKCNTVWKRNFTNRGYCNGLKNAYKNPIAQPVNVDNYPTQGIGDKVNELNQNYQNRTAYNADEFLPENNTMMSPMQNNYAPPNASGGRRRRRRHTHRHRRR